MAFIVAARMSLAVVVVAVFTGAARFGESGPNRGKRASTAAVNLIFFFFNLRIRQKPSVGTFSICYLLFHRVIVFILVVSLRRRRPKRSQTLLFHHQFAARVWIYIALHLLILLNVFSVIAYLYEPELVLNFNFDGPANIYFETIVYSFLYWVTIILNFIINDNNVTVETLIFKFKPRTGGGFLKRFSEFSFSHWR